MHWIVACIGMGELHQPSPALQLKRKPNPGARALLTTPAHLRMTQRGYTTGKDPRAAYSWHTTLLSKAVLAFTQLSR